MNEKLNSIRNMINNEQKKWLITGCAGFIGSHITEFLLSSNQIVTGIDNLSTGSLDNIEYIKKNVTPEQFGNFKFLEADIRDLEKCRDACDDVDYVLHQAALGSVPRSINDPLLSNDANVNGTLNIFHAAKEKKVKRIVFASSSSVYGDNLDDIKTEERIGNPLSPYAVTKKVNEIYSEVFSKVYNMEIVGIRYFNVFGPRQNPNGAYAAVIPRWIKAMINQDPVTIFGDGLTSRDFTYVENVVALNVTVATHKSSIKPGTIINGALGNTTSLNELYQILRTKIQEKIKVNVPELPLYTDFRAGDIRHSNANMKKAFDLFSYAPLIQISEGMDYTVEWYIKSNL